MSDANLWEILFLGAILLACLFYLGRYILRALGLLGPKAATACDSCCADSCSPRTPKARGESPLVFHHRPPRT